MSDQENRCIDPIRFVPLLLGKYVNVLIPCGKCEACKKARVLRAVSDASRIPNRVK